MSRKVTLALIGRGHWGTVYKKTIDSLPNVTLPDKFIFGRDFREGLKKIKSPDVDGVIVAATTSAHFEISVYLLKHGFNRLLIEKPLTQTYAQAKKLQNLLQTLPQAKVLVGHLMLFDPAYQTMKKTSRKLGKILQINYTALKGPPIREGAVLQDAGPHPIYLFMDIARGKPIKITARPTLYDNVELTLEFDNGLKGVANIGTIYPERKRGLIITGEKGKLVLNEFVNPRELLLVEKSGKSKSLSFPTQKTSLELEIMEFTNFIRGKSPKVPLSSGAEVVKIIELAERSLKKGESVLYR
ncbi:MAG: Gfo/Idh/MocA family oxidoreductase [bacterium]|nr:Gfo/Idh/MocA family oxidoreductase [bacterium]